MRFLHGALVILVLWQISQFRSFRKFVLTLCLPKSALLAGVGSKDDSWEELTCESLCSGTLSSTRFSLNSCSHSGMSEWHGSPSSWSRSSFLFGFGFLVGSVNSWSSDISEKHGSLLFLPFNMFTWHSCGMRIYPTLVSPFLSSHTSAWHNWRRHGWWGRRTWGRRGMINFLPWRCHECWRRKIGGRTCWQTRIHDWNEVLRVALYPNTVFNEMWFLTGDPLIRVSVFIAKLSER